MRQLAASKDARRTIRLDVALEAGLREPGSAIKFSIDVADLSVTGMHFKTSMTLRPGARVFVTFPNMASIEAIIAWARGSSYGANFERPLHNAVFDHIAARYRKADD